MSTGAWIAIVSIAVAAGFSLVGVIIQGLLAAFHFGRHAQRLAAVEHRTREVDTNAAALAVLTSTVSGIDRRLQEVADDVKTMMLGSGRSQSRRDPAG
jgi:hypothetical protein